MTPMEMYMEMRKNALNCKAVSSEEKIRVVVQYGRCSKSVGALAVLENIKKTVVEENMENVVVDITGCMGLCSYEPIVTIRKTGRKPVTYCRITPDMARIALSEYVLRGNIIKPWTLDGKEIVL